MKKLFKKIYNYIINYFKEMYDLHKQASQYNNYMNPISYEILETIKNKIKSTPALRYFFKWYVIRPYAFCIVVLEYIAIKFNKTKLGKLLIKIETFIRNFLAWTKSLNKSGFLNVLRLTLPAFVFIIWFNTTFSFATRRFYFAKKTMKKDLSKLFKPFSPFANDNNSNDNNNKEEDLKINSVSSSYIPYRPFSEHLEIKRKGVHPLSGPADSWDFDYHAEDYDEEDLEFDALMLEKYLKNNFSAAELEAMKAETATKKKNNAKKVNDKAYNKAEARKAPLLSYDYKAFLTTLTSSIASEGNNDFDDDSSGIVVEFKDAVVTITGLRNVQLNEMVRFEGGASGLILSLEEKTVRGIIFSGVSSIVVGTRAYRSHNVMVVGVGDAVLGRIVNALGEPLDGKFKIAYEDFMQVERKAPGVISRKKVSEPLITGLKIVDAIVPIGKGQRELILGDRKTGKTTIAVDAILNQRLLAELGEVSLFCFYVAIGKRLSDILSIFEMFKDKGATPYTTIVSASASDPASLQYIAPYTACTMAEYFTYKGGHALIIYDDLSKHADAYRQLALLLRRPVGREAYPGDVFYLHSRLLERAVKLNSDYLGGSLTALPVVETVQGDVSAYIPTNVISITDGQIYLDLNLHQEGIRPAVDAGLSVSRVGSAAQFKSMKTLAGSLKLELAQYREVAQFSKFGSELDAATRKILTNGKLLIEILKQPRNLPLVIYKQVLLLHAASSGFLDVLALNNISLNTYEKSLYAFLETSYIVLPFKRYIALMVDKTLFDFFLFYHYDAWVNKKSSGLFNVFEDELKFGLNLKTNYTVLIKNTLLNAFTNVKIFKKISKKSALEINYCVNTFKQKSAAFNYFLNTPKKHNLLKCYKDILMIKE